MNKSNFLQGKLIFSAIIVLGLWSADSNAAKPKDAAKVSADGAGNGESSSAIELSAEDYRVYCGYLDALERDDIKKLSKKRRDKKIAKLAKMKLRKMKKSVSRGEQVGTTCDEVGKLFEDRSQKALKKAMPGQIGLYILDYSDPSHVVASVRWRGIKKKRLVQEASIIARTLADEVPIAKTIVMRAVNPRVKDPTADVAMWFEARTSPDRAKKMIDMNRIKDFADSRYIRAFDGVKCAKDIAHETQLGYRRGPCAGKEFDPVAEKAKAEKAAASKKK
jgi:hypothetical protein